MGGIPLCSLAIRGFRSIRSLDLKLRSINVLIGPNGAGKSNLVGFFRLVRAIANRGLQRFVLAHGADSLFYLGPKVTPNISSTIAWECVGYKLSLAATAQGAVLGWEAIMREDGTKNHFVEMSGALESRLPPPSRSGPQEEPSEPHADAVRVRRLMADLRAYHFHDTSLLAAVRREGSVRDYDELRPEGENLAAFLLRMQTHQPARYQMIRDAVRTIAPFFDDFLFRPEERGGDEWVRLEWLERGSTYPFQPAQLSDGMLRFVCLVTALLQPNAPGTLILDEPELGLHPLAISLLCELIHSTARQTQIIVATQSPAVVDAFEPLDIVIVQRGDDGSEFRRLDAAELAGWLDEYTLGELWQKNVLRAGLDRA